MGYLIKEYLKIMRPDDKIYITYRNAENEVEYVDHLLLYTHPKGKFSMDKCKEAFEERMKELDKLLEGRRKYILTIEYTMTRVKTYVLDRSPISWGEFLDSEVLNTEQVYELGSYPNKPLTKIQIDSWRCVRSENHRVLDL